MRPHVTAAVGLPAGVEGVGEERCVEGVARLLGRTASLRAAWGEHAAVISTKLASTIALRRVGTGVLAPPYSPVETILARDHGAPSGARRKSSSPPSGR